jgi:hypothetical protein
MITVGHVRPAGNSSPLRRGRVQPPKFPHVACLRDVSALRVRPPLHAPPECTLSDRCQDRHDVRSGHRSACLALHAMLVQAVPLGAIDDHGIDSYSESEFLTKLVDTLTRWRPPQLYPMPTYISGCASGWTSRARWRSMAGLAADAERGRPGHDTPGASDSPADAVRAHLVGALQGRRLSAAHRGCRAWRQGDSAMPESLADVSPRP